jgi:protein LSM14
MLIENRQPQQSRSFNSQQGGYNNPRPTNSRPFNRAAAPKEKLKFDNDYNFEEANQEFQDKLDVVTDELDKVAFDADEKSSDNENEDKEGGESCYDKKSSFFDSISCEAIEKAEGFVLSKRHII